ncbi:GGDEF domain-containing protein [Williamsia sp.]|uniref:GGDEF domain-containing protein n=1 Tax=Williamsia sp. TaxID=1872085 RepID=UPI001A2238C6|nr:GGDEF domain-containing protein [Williamsia sp.]MBJ7289155.1 GGDEF domain-containing protein [Williamsia sp.]
MYTDPEAPRGALDAPGAAPSVSDESSRTRWSATPHRRAAETSDRPVTSAVRPGRRTSGIVAHFDARSAAVLLSTSGALPLPLLAFISPGIIRAGGWPYLGAIWVFTLIVFSTTAIVGRLSDRLFAVFGMIGMFGIAGSAYLVTEPAAAGVIITLLAAIPAISAMSSTPRVVVTFSLVAVVLALGLAFVDPSSVAGVLVKCGAGVANVMVPVFIVAALRSSLEITMARYAVLGDTDPLTGLLNRRGFLTRSRELLAEVAESGDQIGFLLIDVDHFKAVNDRLGHAVGDSVLVDTVVAIGRAAPGRSLIGRFGGEEFVLLCPTSGQAALAAAAERIRLAVSSMSTVTVSIGAVTAPLSSRGAGAPNISQVIDHLTHLADRWVYVAKSAGRDRVVCLSSSPIHFVGGDSSSPGAPGR